MLSASRSRAELIAAVIALRQRLAARERTTAETISDRIARTDACCQMRAEIARLEEQLAGTAVAEASYGQAPSQNN